MAAEKSDTPQTDHQSTATNSFASAARTELLQVGSQLKATLLGGGKQISQSPEKSVLMEALDFGAGVGLTAVTHNRYAATMIKRALAVGFSTAVTGDAFTGHNLKDVWDATTDAISHPENFRQDSHKVGTAIGRTIDDGILNAVSTLSGQIAGRRFSHIEHLLTETNRESFLRIGTVEKDFTSKLPGQYREKEFSESGMRMAKITADGKTEPVFSRDMAFRSNYPKRFRNERAMDKLHGLLGFDSDSAANAIQIEKQDGNSYKMWIQEKRGSDLFDYLERQTGLSIYDRGAVQAYANHVGESPVLKEQLSKTYLERLLAAETDNHPGNIVVNESAPAIKTGGIDADRAFRHLSTPRWSDVPQKNIITNYFQSWSNVPKKNVITSHFQGEPIDSEDLKKVADFVNRFDNFKGRAELGTLGLNKAEVKAYLNRAKWFVNNGIFPEH
jgi:hypothetical protein